jgi:uncharacterized protein (TIGR02001 family)
MRKMASIIILSTFVGGFSLSSFAADTSPAKTNDCNPFTRWGAVTGTFDVTSNYLFRGISQSNNTPAVQGGLNYTLTKPGIYFAFWGSNVNFLDIQGQQATVEMDTNIGVANPITENLSYDISLNRYNYPKAGGANYNELIAIATYRFLKGVIGYSTNVYNTHKTGTYYEAGVNFDLPPKYVYFDGLSLQGAAGYYDLPKTAGYNSYHNYSATISKAISIYKLSLQWTGTDGRAKLAPLDRNQIIATVLANF